MNNRVCSQNCSCTPKYGIRWCHAHLYQGCMGSYIYIYVHIYQKNKRRFIYIMVYIYVYIYRQYIHTYIHTYVYARFIEESVSPTDHRLPKAEVHMSEHPKLLCRRCASEYRGHRAFSRFSDKMRH